MKLRNFEIGNNKPLTLMGGMNVLESRDLAMQVAEDFKKVTDKLNINYIFTSFVNFFLTIGNIYTHSLSRIK